MRKTQTCNTCDRPTNNAYMCRRCANNTHDLLVGSKDVDGQPGITWYAKRLRESAYGQTRLTRSLSAKTISSGYALLGNKRAADLLTRINGTLARWEAIVLALRATQRAENAWVHTGSPTRDYERLESHRARFIAANVVMLRHHSPHAHKLHDELLEYAREAWGIINRPNDVCCGPCPTLIPAPGKAGKEAEPDDLMPCGTLLYAEEGAQDVTCFMCRTSYDVAALREQLKAAVQDMLFTRAELVNLMETRLNDRIPQPTFTKLLRDGRLRPRHIENNVPMFTYNDVCEARLKKAKAS